MHRSRLALPLAAAALLAGCAGPVEQTPAAVPTVTGTVTVAPAANLRTMVSRMMVVGVTDYDSAVAVLEQGVGGIYIYGGTDPGCSPSRAGT